MLHWNAESGEVTTDTVEEMIAFVQGTNSGQVRALRPHLTSSRRTTSKPHRLKIRRGTNSQQSKKALAARWKKARKLAEKESIPVREAMKRITAETRAA